MVGRALAFAASNVVLFSIIRRFREDPQLQRSLASPAGRVIAALVCASAIGTLLWWNWPRERRPFLWVVLLVSAANLTILIHAQRGAGWLSGTAFAPSLGDQLLIYGPGVVGFLAVPLGIYRWLRERSRPQALVVYLAIVGAISLASFPVEEDWVQRGVYVLAEGYSIAWDVTWGAAQWLVGLALYEGWRSRRPPAP